MYTYSDDISIPWGGNYFGFFSDLNRHHRINTSLEEHRRAKHACRAV